jgi:hypothetical protein
MRLAVQNHVMLVDGQDSKSKYQKTNNLSHTTTTRHNSSLAVNNDSTLICSKRCRSLEIRIRCSGWCLKSVSRSSSRAHMFRSHAQGSECRPTYERHQKGDCVMACAVGNGASPRSHTRVGWMHIWAILHNAIAEAQ